MRTSPIHYIAPSAISIVPNCNNSANDLAVTISRGTKIKVYSPRAGIGKTTDGEYQEWTITGRNRRLADSTKPYTIYARLSALDNTAYLIFAPMTPDDDGEYLGAWTQAYSWITTDGLYVFGKGSDWEEQRTKMNCIFVRLGDVSLPDANNQRTVNLDTGILGTDQFNDEWALRPDELPLRIELGCTIGDEDAGPTPYVYWGQSLVLTAMLTEGWTGTDIQRFDRWEIIRNSGDNAADNAWNTAANDSDFRTTGVIELMHGRGATQGVRDDFNSAVNATFIVNAMERTDDPEEGGTPTYAVLKSASIGIMAETWEKYELSLAAQMVTYNPITRSYSPNNGVKFNVRATDQKGDVFLLTNKQLTDAGLQAQYAVIDTDSWTDITISGPDNNVAEGTVPASAFSTNKQSINVRLLNGATVPKELHRTTIAFLRDGEDSKEREWIFMRSTEAITFGTQEHPYPTNINGGQVNPTGAATGSDTNKNQDGWVPQGWWDEQQGTDATNRFEYGAYRDFVKESGNTPAHWGAFTTPKIWNHYGKDGEDGQDMRENLIDHSEGAYTIGVGVTPANDTTSPAADSNGFRRYDVGMTFDPSRVPDDTALSGQMKITFTGCSFGSNANAFIFFNAPGSYPQIARINNPTNGTHIVKKENFVIVSPHNTYDGKARLCLTNFNDGGTVTIERVKLEVGEKCSAWCLSENDKRITKINEVAEYQVADSGTTTPSGTWQSTKQTAIDAYNTAHGISGHNWQPNTFMWTRTTITWSDNSTTALYGAERNPNDGIAGQSIIVDSTEIKYSVQDTNTIDPTTITNWADYNAQTHGVKDKWLWSRTTVTYKKSVDNTSAGSSVTYNCVFNAKNGTNGKAIKSHTEYYKATNSNAAMAKPTSTSGWSTDPNLLNPELTDKWDENHRYLWNMEVTIYTLPDSTDSAPEFTTPHIAATWTKNGKGIDSITDYYQVGTTAPDLPNPIDVQSPNFGNWSTSPDNPPAGQYLWNFERIVWLNSDGTYSYTHTAVHSAGYTGANGTSPYFADIDNGMESIACAYNGHVDGLQEVYTNVSMFYGTTRLNPTITVYDEIEDENNRYENGIELDGITVTINNNGQIEVSFADDTDLSDYTKKEFLIKLVASGQTRYLTFTVNMIRAARNGEHAVLYSLLPSSNEIIKKRDGSYDPAATTRITCAVNKRVGNNPISVAPSSEYTLKYSLDGGTTEVAYPTSPEGVLVSSVTSKLIFILYDKSTPTPKMMDRETIPLVADGNNGQKGTDAQYIYLKGTARDEDSETKTTIPCVVNVNGGTNQATTLRGLNLVTINRQTLSVVESINYDTYGEAAETGTGITDLIAELNALDNSVFVCLVSYDAIGWNSSLISALQDYGMGNLPYTETGRHPFLFIGYKGLGNGNGLMRMRDIGAYTDVVELSVYVANGALSSHDGQDGADGAKGEDAVSVVVSPASMIIEQDINNKNNIAYATDNNLGKLSIQVLKGVATACTITRIVATASNVYVYNSASTGPQQTPSSCDWQPNSQIANLYLKGIAKDNQDNYYTTGQITLAITYTDPDTNTSKTITSIIASVYVNLIGSWSEEVVGDAKTEVAKSLSYAYDPTGQTIIPLESQGQYIKSSTENISILTKKINNGKNLISGVLTGDGWEYGYLDTRASAFHKTGDAFIDNDGFISRDNGEYSVEILSPEVTFEADTDYCLSFDSKGEEDDDEYEAYAVIGTRFGTEVTLTRTGIHYVGTYHSDTAGAKRIVFTAYKIFHPQMEIGTVATAFESGDSEVSSQIKQTADDIRMGVESTGIDITNGKIELRADKTLMRDSNGVEMICFEIVDGLPSIVFYDNHGKTGGNKAWVLNWRGLINIMAHTDIPSWDTSKYSREYATGSTVTARELFYAGSNETPPTGFLPRPDTLYLFHGGYTENSGGIIQWNPDTAIGTDYDSRWFKNNNMKSDDLTPAGPKDDPSNAKVNGYHSFPVTIPQGKEVTLYSFEDGIRDVFAIFRIHCMYIIDITTGRPDPSSYYWYIGEVVEGDPGLVSEDGTYITIPEE